MQWQINAIITRYWACPETARVTTRSKSAYRKLAKKYHPDLNPGDKAAEDKVQRGQRGLRGPFSDTDKRARYDQFGHRGRGPQLRRAARAADSAVALAAACDYGRPVRRLVRRRLRRLWRRAPRQPTMRRARAAIFASAWSLSFDGGRPRLHQRPSASTGSDTCPECGGTGAAKGTSPETCPDCRGSGYVTVQQRTPFGVMQSSQPCSRCGGTRKDHQIPVLQVPRQRQDRPAQSVLR